MALTTAALDAAADKVWDEDRVDHTGAGTFGAVDEWAGSVDLDAIADAVWDEDATDHLGGDKAGQYLVDVGATADPSAIADAVWDEDVTDHLGGDKAGQYLVDAGGVTSPAAIAAAVWATALPGTFGAGEAGYILGTNLDVLVSTRAEPGDEMALVTAAIDAVADQVWEEASADHATADTMGYLQNQIANFGDQNIGTPFDPAGGYP
jgi:hypothetical protein